jgi:hypothetical protein
VVDQAAGRPCRTAPARSGRGESVLIEVADLAGTVDRLCAAGVHLRTELITGVGASKS